MKLEIVIDPFADPEEAVKTAAFFADLQAEIASGNIIMEVDEDGEPRFYPAE